MAIQKNDQHKEYTRRMSMDWLPYAMAVLAGIAVALILSFVGHSLVVR